MIICRSPLRVTFGGGGTDLPSYYENHGGFLISAAIDRYVYVMISEPFYPGITLKYSRTETVASVDAVSHPIVREVLSMKDLEISPRLEIATIADLPAGTGLGSSGSFTTALIKALHVLKRKHIGQEELAELACDIEINKLGQPIGKQDQYIAAFGGITSFGFNQDGSVTSKSLKISDETLHKLEDSILLFFTGISRNASDILRDQDLRSKQVDREMIDNLHYVKELGFRSEKALLGGDLRQLGNLMKEHWDYKKSRSKGMSNPFIDECYASALRHGAIGGKVVGAGGGGFLMFVADDPEGIRHSMRKAGLQEVRFSFDFDGTSTIFS
jgi:D-glycero-alpha-D-manno-heptose-7-phosphate kinase